MADAGGVQAESITLLPQTPLSVSGRRSDRAGFEVAPCEPGDAVRGSRSGYRTPVSGGDRVATRPRRWRGVPRGPRGQGAAVGCSDAAHRTVLTTVCVLSDAGGPDARRPGQVLPQRTGFLFTMVASSCSGKPVTQGPLVAIGADRRWSARRFRVGACRFDRQSESPGAQGQHGAL